jgi:hypothetical protein
MLLLASRVEDVELAIKRRKEGKQKDGWIGGAK